MPGAGRRGTDRPYRYPWEDDDPAADGPGDSYPRNSWDDEDYPSYDWLTTDDSAAGAETWSSLAAPGGRERAYPAASRAVRGFAPHPDDSLPVYPRGPFEPWNHNVPRETGTVAEPGRRAVPAPRDDAAGRTAATISPTDFDTDYSIPAIKDPIPDVSRGSAATARVDGGLAVSGDGSRPGAASRRAVSRASAGSRPSGHPRGSRASVDMANEHQVARQRSASHARHQPVRLVIAVAAVIVIGVAAFLIKSIPSATAPSSVAKRNSTKPTSAPSSPAPPPGPWKYIASRTSDPIPLTSAELYHQSFTAGRALYTRSAVKEQSSCKAALIGASLQSAIGRAGCTQAVRATYLSRTAKIMGTIGVFNLRTFAAATKAARAAGKSQFVAQLPAKQGPTSKIGEGTGLEEAVVKGHYLVLVWADFFNLRAPKKGTQRAKLVSAMNGIVSHTANASLSYRMVYGRPSTSG